MEVSDQPSEHQFLKQKHIQYVIEQDSHKSYEYWLSEHLRMNGLYWGVTALATMDVLEANLPRGKVEEYVMSCWDSASGAFGAFPKHDGHILSTLSALQILLIYDVAMPTLDSEKRSQLTQFIVGLQQDDGSFQGDRFGEIDTRFSYTALSSLSILGELTPEIADPAIAFIMQCQNFDGSFGLVPGSESHAAQVFTCIGSLAICDLLHLLKDDTKLSNWLSERQVLPSGGFNGRPEKLPDVCYSWWVLSSLAIFGKKHWVDLPMLEKFILACQDGSDGGISDRPDNQTDIYHTCFGIAGLSLIDHRRYGFKEIDPVYCMPSETTQHFTKWKRVS
ncbi:type II proteins geranylgeranyltransferase beta subunit [Suhomyces tanzawaensis NRRL Y-17324]|uniref:Geranylgeranyl transferase type-2 subunit beta n=1 Tax=Suhomyces tanzawaensis NRRL Y-17324 TaxID=984487 RepID=A0A1E4SNT9_9ASCO|nr:type II proteins geranylgeranyltransferase beta subunit [Suhomyces tanzawaensis NRRL Y-17324]ODV81087.1 type II proteins geranylgeranyltransferase beta subunit [Suhomyces tanzawaensis NRRL Y-17324]